MLLQIIFIIFIIVSLINIVHFGLYLVGANYYDIQRLLKSSKPPIKKRSKSFLVSVIIPAHNESQAIIKCLESVRKSTHRKLEIIVVDDGSTDDTKSIVRKYISEHPKINIKLMYKQKNSGKAGALNHALLHGVTGEFIMTLDADSILAPKSISNALKYFENSDVVGVAANVRVIDNFKILGLLQVFEYIIGYRSKKFYSITNSEFIIGGVASTYRADILKKVGYYDQDMITEDIALSLKIAAEGNRENRLVYGVDVIAMTEAVGSFTALLRQRYRWKLGILQALFRNYKMFANNNYIYSLSLTLYRIPMAFLSEILILFEPFAIAFVIYLIVKSGNISFVIGIYMTITLYLLWNIWPDENLSNQRKIKMTMYAPFMYFVFYIMNLIQFSAIIHCLFRPTQILRKSKVTSKWVSPERSIQSLPSGL